MNLEHLGDVRRSTLVFNVTQRLLYTKWRDPGEEPKLHLFGQLKRITKQWLDSYLVCKGETYPGLLMYQVLADMACERITSGITRAFIGGRPVKALLDPYNPTGSTRFVRFNTSKLDRWDTGGPPPKNHVDWVVLDSGWEAEFCRVAEDHSKVLAYTKNHNLGFEVPYRYQGENRKYRPDFIVRVDDGRGPDDLLNLVVEIKGYRGEDAKEKKSTMEVYWVPGVNHLGTFGRWAFAEFTEVFEIETDFKARVKKEFAKIIDVAIENAQFPVNRAEELVRSTFSDEGRFISLTRSIYANVGRESERRVTLSELLNDAAGSNCSPDEALAVIGVLSSSSAKLLQMRMRRRDADHTTVSWGELGKVLSEWWRRNSLSNLEWEKWASQIEVDWTPYENREAHK